MTLRFLGPINLEFALTPTARFVPGARQQIRNRRPIGRRGQVYPEGTPGDWIGRHHKTADAVCIAGCKHSGQLILADLPADAPWRRLAPVMWCSQCGARGAVHIAPRWDDMDPEHNPAVLVKGTYPRHSAGEQARKARDAARSPAQSRRG